MKVTEFHLVIQSEEGTNMGCLILLLKQLLRLLVRLKGGYLLAAPFQTVKARLTLYYPCLKMGRICLQALILIYLLIYQLSQAVSTSTEPLP